MSSRMLCFTDARAVIFVLMTGLGTACASQPNWHAVSIRVKEDTVALRRQPEGVSLRMTAIIRNGTPQPLYYDSGQCDPAVQREIEHVWVTVWTPVCPMTTMFSQIAPGDSAIVPIRAFGSSIPNSGQPLDPRMGPGWYRVTFSVGFANPNETRHANHAWSTFQSRASSPFIVKDTVSK